MKILLLCILLLSSCSIINITRFDNNSYQLINNIRTESQNLQLLCGSNIQNDIQHLYNNIQIFTNYQELKLYNDELYNSSKELLILMKQFQNHSVDMSKIYCEMKLKSIENSSYYIQKIIGALERGEF